MLKRISRVLLFSLIVFSFTVAFQNCGQNNFEVDTGDLEASKNQANFSDLGSLSNDQLDDQTGDHNPSSTTPRSGSDLVIPTPSVGVNPQNPNAQQPIPQQTSPTQEIPSSYIQSVRCDSILGQLGWNPSSFIRVDFNPIDNMNRKLNLEYAYDGFGIGLYAETQQSEFVERFRMADAGFAIKLKNKSNGQVVQVANSHFKKFYSSDFDAAASVIKHNNKKTARLNIHIKRSFYESYKNILSEVEVEVSCNGSLALKSLQDFKALSPDLDKQLQKTSYNTYGFATGSPFGFAHLSCVEEIPAGGQVDCSVGGVSIEKIKWYADYVEYPEFADLKVVKAGSLSPGLHFVQAVVTFKDGSTGPTLMRLIRAQ